MNNAPRLEAEPQRDDYLDALRGMAILAVMAVHIGGEAKNLPGWLAVLLNHGRLGVQLFFVVSAFTLIQSADRSGGIDRFDTTGFFVRRFLRIVPAYWLSICVYLLIDFHEGLPADWRPRALASLLFLNYLSPAWVQSGLPPGGWSIVAEAASYFLFPLLYLRLRRPREAVLALALSICAEMFASYHWDYRSPTQIDFLGDRTGKMVADFVTSITIYYGIVTQLPVFLCGLIAAKTKPTAFAGRLGALLIALAIFGSCLVEQFPVKISAFYFGALFALFLKSLQSAPSAVFVNRLTVRLGEISFSLYLVHFAIIDFLRRELAPQTGMPHFLLFAAAVFLTAFILATLANRYVEKPFIAVGRQFRRSPRSNGTALAVLREQE